MEESFSSGLRNWEDMNLDILWKIFSNLSSSDLSLIVTRVCQSCIFEDQGGRGIYLEHWRSSVETIEIPGDMEISDDHLLYIAERATGLKRLILSEPSQITGTGLMKAMCNSKNFRFIHLKQVNYSYFSQIVDKIIQNSSALDMVGIRMNDLPSGKDSRTSIMIDKILDKMKYGSGFVQTNGFISASFYNFDSKVIEPSPDYAGLYYSYPFEATLKMKGAEGDKKGSNEDDDKAVSDSIFLDNITRPQRSGPVLGLQIEII
ncbi:hypothetical protein Patl1_04526 [Pistacia atlantica]|uniref:Uncharacterized protein n=1 Tax=Pistacia atlantica TaxID=434234 RepID=A0ACC1BS58_9ROSI|nr:hypothetical protein Patl1_04526 [Pistacia atlantica]